MHNSNSFYEEPVDNPVVNFCEARSAQSKIASQKSTTGQPPKNNFRKKYIFRASRTNFTKNNLNDMRVRSSTRSVQKIIAFQIGIGQL